MNTINTHTLTKVEIDLSQVVAKSMSEFSVTGKAFRTYDDISVLIVRENDVFNVEVSCGSRYIPTRFDAENVSIVLRNASEGESVLTCTNCIEDRKSIKSEFTRYQYTIELV